MPQKIPATVVTGFLGAGKTTLIRNLLAQADGRRIALIVNEFGDVGVDGEVLKGCGDAACPEDDIVELANGCICCTVADDFLPVMERLVNRADPPEHIVIETSGLALPQPLIQAFNWPGIRTKATIDGVVTVVDGPAAADGRFAHDHAAVDAQRAADPELDHETPLADLFEDQLAAADMVVISKSDLLSKPDADALSRMLTAETRDGVRQVASGPDGLSPAILLGLGAAAEAEDPHLREAPHHHHHDDDDDHDHHHDHDHDAFDSFVVDTAEVADPAAFAEALSGVIAAHNLLRLKGFASVPGKPMRLVLQAVGPRIDTYFDRPLGDDGRGGRFVVIGLAGLDHDAIRAALVAAAAPASASAA